jgi:hypothetical protein
MLLLLALILKVVKICILRMFVIWIWVEIFFGVLLLEILLVIILRIIWIETLLSLIVCILILVNLLWIIKILLDIIEDLMWESCILLMINLTKLILILRNWSTLIKTLILRIIWLRWILLCLWHHTLMLDLRLCLGKGWIIWIWSKRLRLLVKACWHWLMYKFLLRDNWN